jgi:hypothetical protein
MQYRFLFLLLIPTLSFAQSKHDTKIIATVQDTTGLFNRVSLAFYEAGYTMEQKDDALKFLATAPKIIPSYNTGNLKIRALIKGNTIIFSGVFTTGIDLIVKTKENTYYDIEYRGSKGGLFMETWRMMEAVAKQFGTLAYTK